MSERLADKHSAIPRRLCRISPSSESALESCLGQLCSSRAVSRLQPAGGRSRGHIAGCRLHFRISLTTYFNLATHHAAHVLCAHLPLGLLEFPDLYNSTEVPLPWSSASNTWQTYTCAQHSFPPSAPPPGLVFLVSLSHWHQ